MVVRGIGRYLAPLALCNKHPIYHQTDTKPIFVHRISTYRIPASIRVRGLSWVAIGAVWTDLLLTPHLGQAPEKQTHLPITLAVKNTDHLRSKWDERRLLRSHFPLCDDRRVQHLADQSLSVLPRLAL